MNDNEKNRNERRDKKAWKRKVGMRVSQSGRALALILHNLRSNGKDKPRGLF